MPLNSPGGSTLQWVHGKICRPYNDLFVFDAFTRLNL